MAKKILTKATWFVASLIAVSAIALGIYAGRGGFPGIWGDKSLEELLLDCRNSDTHVRVAALITLGRHPEHLPESVEGILPNLLHSDELIRIAAETAVRGLKSELVPYLKPFLHSETRELFYSACSAIRAIGAPAVEYVPILVERLDSDDTNTQLSCLFALESLGTAALPALDKLIGLLDSSDEQFNLQVRACAIMAKLGPAAKSAVPRLVQLSKEGVLSSRSMACLALGAIGPVEGEDVIGLLTAKLDAFYVLERERALIGLGYLGPAAAPALDKIKALMEDPDKSVQPLAAFAFWRITGDDATALAIMSAALKSYDFREQALGRLSEMGSAAQPLVPEIAALFTDVEEEKPVRESAIRTLAQLGPAAQVAIPQLKKMLRDDDLLLSEAAREAILAIDPEK